MSKTAWLAVAATACGLISSDVANVSLGFPSHAFTLDSAEWQVPTTASTVPAIPCSADCDAISAMICSPQRCSVDCNPDTGNCQGHVIVGSVNDYNLAAEAPEYQRLSAQSAISVTIDDVWFQIGENSLNVATPELGIYAGPSTATSPTDEGVVAIGVIPSIPAGATGRQSLQFADGGRNVVKRFVDDYKTPFRVMVYGVVTLQAGDAVPQGRVVGEVKVTAHVGLK